MLIKKILLSLSFVITCASSTFALQGLENLVEAGKEEVVFNGQMYCKKMWCG